MSNYIGKTAEFLVCKQIFIPSASWFCFGDVQKKISKLNTCFKSDSNILKTHQLYLKVKTFVSLFYLGEVFFFPFFNT